MLLLLLAAAAVGAAIVHCGYFRYRCFDDRVFNSHEQTKVHSRTQAADAVMIEQPYLASMCNKQTGRRRLANKEFKSGIRTLKSGEENEDGKDV